MKTNFDKKNPVNPIVIWINCVTAHQADFLSELSKLEKNKLTILTKYDDLNIKSRLGWASQKLPNSVKLINFSQLSLFQLVQLCKNTASSKHVFFGFTLGFKALIAAYFLRRQRSSINVVTEPYSEEGYSYFNDKENFITKNIRKALRPLSYKFYFLIFRKIDTFFSISAKASPQFTQLGMTAKYHFRFGYFVRQAQRSRMLDVSNGPEIKKVKRLVFVGSNPHRKGLDILIDALSLLDDKLNLSLDIWGFEQPKNYSNPKIKYRGFFEINLSQTTIANYDLLILPSRFDGWGVVVNEALLQGIPVITSDAVGASELLTHLGDIFICKANDPKSLSKSINAFYTLDNLAIEELIKKIYKLQQVIEPRVAASYFYNALQWSDISSGVKPSPPWLE